MKKGVDRYLTTRQILGYDDKDKARDLRKFADYVEHRGSRHVLRRDVTDYLANLQSADATRRVFYHIKGYCDWVRAEDEQNEELEARFHGIGKASLRVIPFIYTDEDTLALIDAIGTEAKKLHYNARTCQILVGLLAATGMRLGEALAIQTSDLTDNKLFIRKSKFRKQRRIALRPSALDHIHQYLSERPGHLDSPSLLVFAHNKTPKKTPWSGDLGERLITSA